METRPNDRPRTKRRRILRLLAGLLVLALALRFALPTVLCAIPWPEFTFDLSGALGANARLFRERTLALRPDLSRTRAGYALHAEGHLLDWPLRVRATVVPGWLSAKGRAEISLPGTPWAASVEFAAPSLREWSATATLAPTGFSERDPVLAPVLPRLLSPAVSNLVFSGSVAAEATARRTKRLPVTAWEASASVERVDASLSAAGIPVAATNLRVRATAGGIADRTDLAPLRPSADLLSVMTIPLTNFYATVFADGSRYLVTEAGAGCGGGNLRAYSVYVNPENLSSGFTLVLDGIDAGAVLARVTGFRGEATGRLNGKVQLFLRNGRELRLRESYLYSIPGETGRIRVDDATPVTDALAAGGVSRDQCANLAKALANLDYDLLKVNLRRESADSLALNLALNGSATSGRTTVPVSFDVTFHGALDELVNLGLKVKGK